MRKKIAFSRGLKLFAVFAGLATFLILLTSSSHREAPLISNDPLADNTDLYAFRSPDKPDKSHYYCQLHSRSITTGRT